MARRRYIRRGAGKSDGGASWISYSDMMAALLLGWRLKKRPPVSEPEASAPGQ